MLAARQQHHQGRSQDRTLAPSCRLGAQRLMGAGDAAAHLGQHLGGRHIERHALQGVGDGPGRDVARLMPARAVRHRPKAKVGPVDELILVVRPARARMGRGPGAEAPGGARLSFDRSDGRHALRPSLSMDANASSSGSPGVSRRQGRTNGEPSVHQSAVCAGLLGSSAAPSAG